MLAKDNEYIESASETIYRIVANERIREQCEAREEALRFERDREVKIKKLDKVTEERDQAQALVVEKDRQLSEKDNLLSEKDTLLAEKDNQLADMNSENARLHLEIEKLKQRLQHQK